MSNDASQTRRTPTAEYTAVRNDIARLLDLLDMELGKHDERAKAAAKKWFGVDLLRALRGDLVDAVAFIAIMERSEVEAFLDDAV